MNLNKVYLIGRLAADPELRTTPTGQNVATLRVATNRVWNDKSGQKQEQVEFHTVIAWGALADISSRYLKKGQVALFEGRLQNRSWQGADGVKKYKTEIVAEAMQLGPKASGASYEGQQESSYSRPAQPASTPISRPQAKASPVREEDIPVINEDAPVSSDPIASSNDFDEREIDLKDIPF